MSTIDENDRPTAPEPSQVRASDAEREATVARLHHALGEGRLDLTETETRVAAAYAARYRSDLPTLLADLPDHHGAPSDAPSWTAVWTSVVWRLRVMIWGTTDAAQAAPTPRQCRLAAMLTMLAALWVLACAVLGAALVGA